MIGGPRTLLTDIGQLVMNTGEPGTGEDSLAIRTNQAVLLDDGQIVHVGNNDDPWVSKVEKSAEIISIEGSCVIPGFVDSHTHMIHGGDRLQEFLDRMSGKPYTPGGINTTVAATRAATDQELRASLAGRVDEALRQGTTTIEIKTGYGLDIETESRLARIASEFTGFVTFLGAHVVPADFEGTTDEYLNLVCGRMMQACLPYCRYIDVFLEEGAFNVEQARRVLEAGKSASLIPKLHAGQLGHGGGAALAIEVGAYSLDHGTYLSDEDLELLSETETVVTLLPGTEFATRSEAPDARRLLEAGVTVALASNCNPGSGFSSSMPLMIALAVRDMHMTPGDALWSATQGGAQALKLQDRGRISLGLRADLIQLTAPHYAYLAYRPGVPLIRRVFQGGEVVVDHAV